MDRPRVVRLLRIAWSISCLTACVLLIALWVRSYWWGDTFEADVPPLRKMFLIDSTHGRMGIFQTEPLTPGWRWLWTRERLRKWAGEPSENMGFDIVPGAMSGVFV